MELEEYFNNNQFGLDIWKNKYQYNNESFDEWLDRISNGNHDIRELIVDKKFLFAGRILANRQLYKHGLKVTYSNCYFNGSPEDNIESIYEDAGKMARTYSYGGGTGIDLSKLSPAGARINNAAKETSGALSFADIYNLTTALIGQEGRRGALMISLASSHPSLPEFITIKSDLGKLTKANISVRFFDEFMSAVEGKRYVTLKFERETGYVVERVVNASDLFDTFVENNWDYAEPGAAFWDRILSWSLLTGYDDIQIEGLNPCGEQPLPAGGTCLLGSMNWAAYVNDSGNFDLDEFREDIHTVVKAMNEVLDEGRPLHPLAEQRAVAYRWRLIGIGPMGMADALIKMRIRYGSYQCIEMLNKIGAAMVDEALHASALLAATDGPYPGYNEDIVLSNPFFMANASERTIEAVKKYGLRNAQILTVAPTGSISNMLGISGGIEPIFAMSYKRRTESLHKDERVYEIATPIANEYMLAHGLTDIKQLPEWFITTDQIPYKERIDVQATLQKYIDASISSTVNLPENTTVDEIRNLYIYAWKQGLKGVTIFRKGCKRDGILSTEDTGKVGADMPRGYWKPLAKDTVYHPAKIYTGCGKLKLMIGYSEQEKSLQDFYIIKSGAGGCERTIQSLTIAMSGMLRLGGSLDNIEQAFEGVGGCASFALSRSKGACVSKGNNCGAAILNSIRGFCASMKDAPQVSKPTGLLCPECKSNLIPESGCFTCKSCGYSKCG